MLNLHVKSLISLGIKLYPVKGGKLLLPYLLIMNYYLCFHYISVCYMSQNFTCVLQKCVRS